MEFDTHALYAFWIANWKTVLPFVGLGTSAGTVLGAFVAWFANRDVKRFEYLSAYNQKLADKRINALEKLESAIIPFAAVAMDGSKKVSAAVFMSEDHFQKCFASIQDQLTAQTWLSKDARKRFHAFVANLNLIAQTMEINDASIVEMGRVYGAFVGDQASEMLKVIRNEYFIGHNINKLGDSHTKNPPRLLGKSLLLNWQGKPRLLPKQPKPQQASTSAQRAEQIEP